MISIPEVKGHLADLVADLLNAASPTYHSNKPHLTMGTGKARHGVTIYINASHCLKNNAGHSQLAHCVVLITQAVKRWHYSSLPGEYRTNRYKVPWAVGIRHLMDVYRDVCYISTCGRPTNGSGHGGPTLASFHR